MPIKYQLTIMRNDLRINRDWFYVFGDNCERVGLGGQAKQMRGEKNAIGIRTKKKPKRTNDSYFSDDEFKTNCILIDADLQQIEDLLKEDHVVIIPKNGIGTGLSELDIRAPKTFEYLMNKLERLKHLYE